jgi:hypothetical protein
LPPPTPADTLCGSYVQPCRADGSLTPPVDVTATAAYRVRDHTYAHTRTAYAPGLGCDAAPLFAVAQHGTLREVPDAEVLIGGGIRGIAGGRRQGGRRRRRWAGCTPGRSDSDYWHQ